MKTFIYCSFLITIALMCQSCQEEPPSFIINTSATDIVAGQSITFSESSATGTTTQWTFEGANIPTSNAKSIAVTYNTPGTYTAKAVVSNKSKSTTQSTVITVHKATWSFIFPGGGQRNNNATIGDFCCTGETATLLNQNNKPLSYAYFFSWDGQAYNLPPSSIAPNFRILLSGTTDLKGVNTRAQSSIFFSADECAVGKTKQVRVGNLQYTVRITNILYPTGTAYANTHFWMDSLKVLVTVNWVI